MNLAPYFKSIIDADRAPVVVCDLSHTILYMNEAAVERYKKAGGKRLVGKSLLSCHTEEAQEKILSVLRAFEAHPEHRMVYEFRNDEENKDVYLVALRDDEGRLIGYYEKHEYRDRESAGLYEFAD